METFFIPRTEAETVEFNIDVARHLTIATDLLSDLSFPVKVDPAEAARFTHQIMLTFDLGFSPQMLYMHDDKALALVVIPSGRPIPGWDREYNDEKALFHAQTWTSLFPYMTTREVNRVVFVSDSFVHTPDSQGKWDEADDREALVTYVLSDNGLNTTMQTYTTKDGTPNYDDPVKGRVTGGAMFTQLVRASAERRLNLRKKEHLPYTFAIQMMAGNEYRTLVMS